MDLALGVVIDGVELLQGQPCQPEPHAPVFEVQSQACKRIEVRLLLLRLCGQPLLDVFHQHRCFRLPVHQMACDQSAQRLAHPLWMFQGQVA